MLRAIKEAVKRALDMYPEWLCKREYRYQTFARFNERPVELGFAFRKLAEVYPMKVLDVGTGTTALPHLMSHCGFLVTATDNIRDYWPKGMTNRHYHVINDDITRTQLTETFDFITCISVLEHIKASDEAVRSIFRLLRPAGHLVVSFPYNEKEYSQNVYKLPGSSYGQNASYVTQAYSRGDLNRWLEANNAEILDQEYWQFWDGEFWTVGNQIIPPKRVGSIEMHQLTCVHIKKR